jgi:hypothetical protein
MGTILEKSDVARPTGAGAARNQGRGRLDMARGGAAQRRAWLSSPRVRR